MNTELLWSLLIKGSLIVALAALASLAMSRTSAARRHIVWLAGLAGLLLLPLAEIRLPNWNVSPEKSLVVRPFMTPAPLRSPAFPHDSVKIASPTVALAPVAAKGADLPGDIAASWLTGFLVLVGWTTVGLARVAMLVRSGKPWKSPQSLNPTVRILLCRGLQVPATAGLLRPVILLPEEATTWREDRLRMVIAHESAHIRRRDWTWQLIAQFACALHFFNPLAWISARQLRTESEFACDDYVLGLGIEPTRYAEELLCIARRARFQMANSVGMARSPNVEGRLRSIVDGHRNRKLASGTALISALAATLLLVTPLAVLKAVPGLGARHQLRSHPLPQIPSVDSRQEAPHVFLAEDGIAGLPDGLKVRLVGIAPDDQAQETWGMDGQPLQDAYLWSIGNLYWQGNVFHRWSHGGMGAPFASFSRSFVVEIESANQIEAATTSRIVDPGPQNEPQRLNPLYSGGDDRVPEVDLKPNDPAYAIISMGIPSHTQTGTYRFGIAGSDWQTIADVKNTFEGAPGGVAGRAQGGKDSDACGISLGERPLVFYIDAKGDDHELNLLGSKTIPRDTAIRAILYDREGSLIDQPDPLQFDVSGSPTLRFKAATFARISRIVLQTSPYEWAEFRNVPLRPDYAAEVAKRLDPGIHGTATGIAPGFSKTLSDGVTVSVDAVTKAALDGPNWKFTAQPWWRADGEVLKQGPSMPDFPMRAQVWGKQPLVRFHIDYKGAVKGANTYVQATGPVDPSYWLKDELPRSDPGTESLITEFLPNSEKGGVKVGVANGPWKTIASRIIDVPEEPPLTGKAVNAVNGFRTGVEMSLADIPQFGKAAGDREAMSDLVDHSLAGFARRYVAVLKSGEEKVLIPGGLGVRGVEMYALPARHGEATEIYNGLLASQVREIELQTRPYEWVEFDGIALNHN